MTYFYVDLHNIYINTYQTLITVSADHVTFARAASAVLIAAEVSISTKRVTLAFYNHTIRIKNSLPIKSRRSFCYRWAALDDEITSIS